MLRASWEGDARADVTISLPDSFLAECAAEDVRDAILAAGGGYTERPCMGGWEGAREYAYIFSIVSKVAPERTIAAAVHAAHRAGCTAVQVERWGVSCGRKGYSVAEYRPDPETTLSASMRREGLLA